MKTLTLYTGTAGFNLAQGQSNLWATTTGHPEDYKFTINSEDVVEIREGLYEVANYESVEWLQ